MKYIHPISTVHSLFSLSLCHFNPLIPSSPPVAPRSSSLILGPNRRISALHLRLRNYPLPILSASPKAAVASPPRLSFARLSSVYLARFMQRTSLLRARARVCSMYARICYAAICTALAHSPSNVERASIGYAPLTTLPVLRARPAAHGPPSVRYIHERERERFLSARPRSPGSPRFVCVPEQIGGTIFHRPFVCLEMHIRIPSVHVRATRSLHCQSLPVLKFNRVPGWIHIYPKLPNSSLFVTFVRFVKCYNIAAFLYFFFFYIC